MARIRQWLCANMNDVAGFAAIVLAVVVGSILVGRVRRALFAQMRAGRPGAVCPSCGEAVAPRAEAPAPAPAEERVARPPVDRASSIRRRIQTLRNWLRDVETNRLTPSQVRGSMLQMCPDCRDLLRGPQDTLPYRELEQRVADEIYRLESELIEVESTRGGAELHRGA